MSSKLVILSKKKWNVWNQDNIERVLKDEREHEEKEKEKKKRAHNIDQERRIDAMKRQQNCHDSDLVDPRPQHINFFEDIERRLASSGGNKEHEMEKQSDEKKKLERMGIAPWALGAGSAEASGTKPWYEYFSRSGDGDVPAASVCGREIVGPEAVKANTRELMRKNCADPLMDIHKGIGYRPSSSVPVMSVKSELAVSTSSSLSAPFEKIVVPDSDALGLNKKMVKIEKKEKTKKKKKNSKHKRKSTREREKMRHWKSDRSQSGSSKNSSRSRSNSGSSSSRSYVSGDSESDEVSVDNRKRRSSHKPPKKSGKKRRRSNESSDSRKTAVHELTSSEPVSNNTEMGEDKLALLRLQRLARERREREKVLTLYAPEGFGANGRQATASNAAVKPRYNSQFNPDIAKQNYEPGVGSRSSRTAAVRKDPPDPSQWWLL